MPNDYTRGAAPTVDQSMSGILVMALGTWSPWLVGTAKLSAHVHEGFGTLASEWQNFVGRRLKEDFAFVQQIAQSRTPDQILAAHAEFWQKAMEDYSKEYLLIGSLAAGVTTKSLAAAQSATQEVSMEMLPLLKAA